EELPAYEEFINHSENPQPQQPQPQQPPPASFCNYGYSNPVQSREAFQQGDINSAKVLSKSALRLATIAIFLGMFSITITIVRVVILEKRYANN
ncbi:hypothetical protein PoB_002754600, partial [Plakobranchus ocellatus]